jgi:hypothetical protein
MHIERENPSVLAKVTQVSDVAHGPLVAIYFYNCLKYRDAAVFCGVFSCIE